MSRLRLAKLDATGNTFLVAVDLDDAWGSLAPDLRAHLCRSNDVDGFIRIVPGRDGADLGFELTNADGGPAEMSGNGMRCLAWVAVHEGLVPGTSFTVSTAGRTHRVEYAETPETSYARVDMGPVTFEPAAIPLEAPSPFGLTATVDGTTYEGDAAGMPNPHLVLFVDEPEVVPVTVHGPVLEHDPRFPKRTNVEFVAVEPADSLRMRVWERGVGETLSCGTGACAAAAAARRRGLVGDHVTMHVRGGRLTIDLGGDLGETIWLGGPVTHVTDVVVDLVQP
jgi:diaminopimelate epimerase